MMMLLYIQKRLIFREQRNFEKALSGFYYVNTGERYISCRARGKFRKDRITPLVGDWVEIQELDDGTGYVESIEPRKCEFVRPAVANIDQMVIIASQAIPVSDPYLIDRVCAIAELKGCDVVICINKCDLENGEKLAQIYEQVRPTNGSVSVRRQVKASIFYKA